MATDVFFSASRRRRIAGFRNIRGSPSCGVLDTRMDKQEAVKLLTKTLAECRRSVTVPSSPIGLVASLAYVSLTNKDRISAAVHSGRTNRVREGKLTAKEREG
jgi:hypothetical protein